MIMKLNWAVGVQVVFCCLKHDTCVQCVVDIHHLQSYQTGLHKVIVQQTNMLNIKEKSHFTSACARHFLFQLISTPDLVSDSVRQWCFVFFVFFPGEKRKRRVTYATNEQRTPLAGGWLTARVTRPQRLYDLDSVSMGTWLHCNWVNYHS